MHFNTSKYKPNEAKKFFFVFIKVSISNMSSTCRHCHGCQSFVWAHRIAKIHGRGQKSNRLQNMMTTILLKSIHTIHTTFLFTCKLYLPNWKRILRKYYDISSRNPISQKLGGVLEGSCWNLCLDALGWTCEHVKVVPCREKQS